MCVSSLSETKSEDGNLFTSDKCHKESENFKYCNVEVNIFFIFLYQQGIFKQERELIFNLTNQTNAYA